MNKKIKAKFFGNVQGVGFRYQTKMLADELGLNGFIKNTTDGAVELEAEGEEKILKDFLEKIKKNFDQYIKDVSLEWFEANGQDTNFSLKFD